MLELQRPKRLRQEGGSGSGDLSGISRSTMIGTQLLGAIHQLLRDNEGCEPGYVMMLIWWVLLGWWAVGAAGQTASYCDGIR